MVYSAWNSKWLEVWNNTKYKIEVEYGYRQNPATNKTQYRATRLRVASLTAYHSFYNEGSATAGIGVGTESNDRTSSGGLSVSVAKNGSAIIDLTDVTSEEITHETDGSLETKFYIYGYFDAGLGGQNSSPSGGWNSATISVPAIDRVAPVTTATVKTVTTNTVSLTVTSDAKTQYARCSIDNGVNWTYVVPPSELAETNGGTGTLSLEALEPNTQYTLLWQVRRDYNEVWSDSVTVTFTTLSDQKVGYGKPFGTWKKGLYLLKNGIWKKVKEVFIKNGTWRKT